MDIRDIYCSVCNEDSCFWLNQIRDSDDELNRLLYKEDRQEVWEVQCAQDDFDRSKEYHLYADLEDEIGLDVMVYFDHKHERLGYEAHPLVKGVYPTDHRGDFKAIIIFKRPLSFDEVCCAFRVDCDLGWWNLPKVLDIDGMNKVNQETDHKAEIEMLEIVYKSILHDPEVAVGNINRLALVK